MTVIFKWLIAAASIFGAAYFIPGISVVSFYSALIASLVLGVLNITVKPILYLLTLPVNMVTFGLFSIVINAVIFWFLSTIVKGIEISGFTAALLGSLFVSAVMFVADKILSRD